MSSDPFFSSGRPFTKRKREDNPNRSSLGGASSNRRNGGGDRARNPNRSSSAEQRTRGSKKQRGTGGRGIRGASGDKDKSGKRPSRKENDDDEELDEGGGGLGFDSSDDDGENGQAGSENETDSGEDDDAETPAQKRLRLSKMYLETLAKENEDLEDETAFDAADLDRDHIAARLQRDVLEHSNRIHNFVASSLRPALSHASFITSRTPSSSTPHRAPITSVTATSDLSTIFTAGKDGIITKWHVNWKLPSTSTTTPQIAISKEVVLNRKHVLSKRKRGKLENKEEDGNGTTVVGKVVSTTVDEGHDGAVLSLAVDGKGEFLVSAGQDKVVGVWSVKERGKATWLRGLGGHKDAVTSVGFRIGSTEFLTASLDRTVKLYSASSLSYIDTLFGHQDSISNLSILRSPFAVTAGSRDRTARWWKVEEETQLVFRSGGGGGKVRKILEGGLDEEEDEGDAAAVSRKKRALMVNKDSFIEGSVDCVTMVDEATFISGSDSGSISLWTTTKKKPLFVHPLAHGVNEYASATEGVVTTPRWITSLACLPYGDVFASGSWDGQIRLWKLEQGLKSFLPLSTIPCLGFINSLQILRHSLTTTSQPLSSAKDDDRSSTPSLNGVVILAAIGKEPRLGRWMRIKEAKEGALVTFIPQDTVSQSK